MWKENQPTVVKTEDQVSNKMFIFRSHELWQDTFSFVLYQGSHRKSLCVKRHHCSKPSPDPSCSALHQNFLPTGCTIRSLLSGLESGGCVGSKKWALSHWIMPLFRLLWPGMPNFTARYSSLCVNQSFARGRGAYWVRLQHRVRLIQPLIPQKLYQYMYILHILTQTSAIYH